LAPRPMPQRVISTAHKQIQSVRLQWIGYSTAVSIRFGLFWRPGPHGSGGKPPLGSFSGLRSRTLVSLFAFFFFGLSCMLPFDFFVVMGVLSLTDVLRKILRSLTLKSGHFSGV